MYVVMKHDKHRHALKRVKEHCHEHPADWWEHHGKKDKWHDIIAEVKNKSESILNLNSDPVAIVNGIKPIVFSYIKSGNLTKNQAIETASRMVALVSLVSAGSSMPDVR